MPFTLLIETAFIFMKQGIGSSSHLALQRYSLAPGLCPLGTAANLRPLLRDLAKLPLIRCKQAKLPLLVLAFIAQMVLCTSRTLPDAMANFISDTSRFYPSVAISALEMKSIWEKLFAPGMKAYCLSLWIRCYLLGQAVIFACVFLQYGNPNSGLFPLARCGCGFAS